MTIDVGTIIIIAMVLDILFIAFLYENEWYK